MADMIFKFGQNNVSYSNANSWAHKTESVAPSYELFSTSDSGRDALTGKMYRTIVANKRHWDVSMLRLTVAEFNTLYTDLGMNQSSGDPVIKLYISDLADGVNQYGEYNVECDTLTVGSRFSLQGVQYVDGVTFSLIEY